MLSQCFYKSSTERVKIFFFYLENKFNFFKPIFSSLKDASRMVFNLKLLVVGMLSPEFFN